MGCGFRWRGKDWIKAGIRQLVVAHPEAAFRVAGTVGRRLSSLPGLRMTPAASEVSSLLGDLSSREIARIRREIGALERRNQALFVLVENRGMEPLLPLVRVSGEEHMTRLKEEGVGAILADWHVGVPLAHIAALIELGVPTLSLAVNPPVPSSHPLPDWIRCGVGQADSSSFLVHALQRLRTGGVTLIGINGLLGEAFAEVPFLGRRTRAGRGAGTLARLTGARIVPVTCTWAQSGAHIDVAFHAPIAAPCVPKKERVAYEDALLRATARWFEKYVRAHPEQLRLIWLRDYVQAERCTEVV